MRRDDAAYLLDMLLHARDARGFVAGLIEQVEPLVPPETG